MISKERIYHFIEPSYEPGRFVDIGIITLIFLNIVALILETVEPVYNYNRAAFEAFEDFSLVLFTLEYTVRHGGARPEWEYLWRSPRRNSQQASRWRITSGL